MEIQTQVERKRLSFYGRMKLDSVGIGDVLTPLAELITNKNLDSMRTVYRSGKQIVIAKRRACSPNSGIFDSVAYESSIVLDDLTGGDVLLKRLYETANQYLNEAGL